MTSDLARREDRGGVPAERLASTARSAPPRPALTGKESAPIIVKRPPPVSVGIAVIILVLSLVAGAVGVVYLFIIRETQLAEIVDAIKAVDSERADETYQLAADIIYWALFGGLAAIMLMQITFIVSFTNRRTRARWMIFASLLVLTALYVPAHEVVAVGERGAPLQQVLLLQLALGALGLAITLLPPALQWTARRHDVRGGSSQAH